MWNGEAGLGGGQDERAGTLSIDGIKEFLCLQHGYRQRECGSPDISRKNKNKKGVSRSYSPQKSRPLLVPMSKHERHAKLAIRAIAMAAQKEEGEVEESKVDLDFSLESPTNASRLCTTWATARESSNNRSSTIDSLSEMAFSFDTDEPESLTRSQSDASTAYGINACGSSTSEE
jgi:hypothetical protein